MYVLFYLVLRRALTEYEYVPGKYTTQSFLCMLQSERDYFVKVF